MTQKITFSGTTKELKQKIDLIGSILSGRSSAFPEMQVTFTLAVGLAFLANIKDAYITKARGGTDELGIQWKPLKPETIANRRVGPGDTRRGAPNADAIRERQRIERREYRRLLTRFLATMPRAEAERRARQAAAQIATRQTGKTKKETLGGRNVEMLRDTGVLLNSLTPADRNGSSYTSPPEQIMEVRPGSVTVGTNVLYARTHQEGDDTRGIPARPFLPRDGDQLPQTWVDDMNDAAKVALEETISELFRRKLAA